MRVIRDGAVIEDGWRLLSDTDPLPETGEIILPFARWQRDRDGLAAFRGKLGVAIAGDEDLDAVARDLDRFSLIALDFPTFRDGRNYSNARLLRDRYGFRGELRAVGNVLRDQLFYMARCGIQSFALAPGKDPEEALQGLQDFSVTYQAAGDGRVPIWRRRH